MKKYLVSLVVILLSSLVYGYDGVYYPIQTQYDDYGGEYIIGPNLQGVYRILQTYTSKKIEGAPRVYELTPQQCRSNQFLARIEGRQICLINALTGWFNVSDVQPGPGSIVVFKLNWSGFKNFVLLNTKRGTTLLIGVKPDESVYVIEMIKIMEIEPQY